MDPQITKNFAWREFRCHDGTDVPFTLMDNVRRCAKNLQALRDEIGKPIKIISGYRNPSYNRLVAKGSDKSQHMEGLAADIRIAGMPPSDVASTVERLIKEGKMEEGGLGTYGAKNFTHVDCRGTRARWKG